MLEKCPKKLKSFSRGCFIEGYLLKILKFSEGFIILSLYIFFEIKLFNKK